MVGIKKAQFAMELYRAMTHSRTNSALSYVKGLL